MVLWVIGVLAGLTVAFHLGDPAWFPADWITVLHEGLTLRNIDALGASYQARALGFDPTSGSVPLRTHVWSNLWASACQIPIAAALGVAMVRRRWGAAAAVAVLCLNPGFLHAAVSERTQAMVNLLIMAGVVSSANLFDPAPVVRFQAVGTLFVLGLCGLAARLEVVIFCALFVGAALLIAVADARLRAWRDATERYIRRHIEAGPTRLLIWLTWPLVVSVSLTSPGWWLAPTRFPPAPWAFPFFETLRLPLDLVALYPLGTVVLIGVGMVWAARWPVRSLGLTVALISMGRVYATNSHWGGAPFETLRYLSHLNALFMVASLFGLRALTDWAATVHLPLSAGRAWAVAGCFTVLLPRPGSPHFGPTGVTDTWLITRNHQIEARYLVNALDKRPECGWTARVAVQRRARRDNQGREFAMSNVFFGWFDENGRRVWKTLVDPLPSPGQSRPPRHTPDSSQSPHWPAKPCFRHFSGLSCALEGGEGCSADAGHAEEQTLSAHADEYNTHHGDRRSPFVLRTEVR